MIQGKLSNKDPSFNCYKSSAETNRNVAVEYFWMRFSIKSASDIAYLIQISNSRKWENDVFWAPSTSWTFFK